MKNSEQRLLLAKAGAGLASLTLSCTVREPARPNPVNLLLARSQAGNAALMRGDAQRYAELIPQAPDFTLMSPFGGEPARGALDGPRIAALGRFFRDGTLEQDVIRTYRAPDMVVLVVIERAHVAVGGLPAQDWSLRVTLVYRREGEAWLLVHRHADPLGASITLRHAASLARGERPPAE